jgi:hypothetical protein
MAYIETPSLATNDFFTIKFIHLPTETEVQFKGWVNEFSDQFTSIWNETPVYGRMDPMSTFQRTSRQIALAFSVVSDSRQEAVANLANVNALIEFLYPVYQKSSGRSVQNTLKAGPLIGMQWTNLISDASSGARLTGYLGGLTYSPQMDQGGFVLKDQSVDTTTLRVFDSTNEVQRNTTVTDKRSYIPKRLDINLDYTVLHTHLTGWYKDGQNGYVFGDKNVNGKFPNASYIKTVTNIDAVSTTAPDGTTSGSLSVTNDLTNEALVLE